MPKLVLEANGRAVLEGEQSSKLDLKLGHQNYAGRSRHGNVLQVWVLPESQLVTPSLALNLRFTFLSAMVADSQERMES